MKGKELKAEEPQTYKGSGLYTQTEHTSKPIVEPNIEEENDDDLDDYDDVEGSEDINISHNGDSIQQGESVAIFIIC